MQAKVVDIEVTLIVWNVCASKVARHKRKNAKAFIPFMEHGLGSLVYLATQQLNYHSMAYSLFYIVDFFLNNDFKVN